MGFAQINVHHRSMTQSANQKQINVKTFRGDQFVREQIFVGESAKFDVAPASPGTTPGGTQQRSRSSSVSSSFSARIEDLDEEKLEKKLKKKQQAEEKHTATIQDFGSRYKLLEDEKKRNSRE